MTGQTSRGQRGGIRAGKVMLAGLVLLASVASAAAQSKGYRPPPPPPPPMPRPSAPAAPPPRTTTSPPPRSPNLTASGPSSPAPKPSAPVSSPKGGTTPKSGTTQKPPDYAKMNPSELQKSIGSDTKQIDAYRAKVNNPRANQPNWNSLSRDQQGALMRQWNDEIRRHEASRATAQRMLSQKAR